MRYIVKMRCQPVWCVVEEAVDKEEAIEKAINEDEWTEYSDYGGEEYSAELIEED